MGRRLEPHVVRDAGGGAATGARARHYRRRAVLGRASKRWRRVGVASSSRKSTPSSTICWDYTPDAYAHGAAAVDRASSSPRSCSFPHTYQVRDFPAQAGHRAGQGGGERRGRAPRRQRRQLVAGAAALPGQGERRPALRRRGPHFASLQAGAYRADQGRRARGSALRREVSRRIAAGHRTGRSSCSANRSAPWT
jgi:hypothetical protein